jgi:hypothetical protein
MIYTETEWICPAQKAIDRHGKWNTPFINGLAKRYAIARPPDEDVREASPKEKQA